MKTGRLLKFHRPGAEIHAYLYQDGDVVHAAVYVLAPGRDRVPAHEIRAESADEVETAVRSWIDTHFPRAV